jgi:hypothetical protein
MTKVLNGLRNKTTKAARKMKESERRCMVDDDISECDCERLRGDLTGLRSTYQERHGLAYDDYRIGIEEEINTNPKSFFFRYVDLKRKLGVTRNLWLVPSDPGPDDVSYEPFFGSFQFTILEVLNALLDLDSNKGNKGRSVFDP